MVDGITSVSPRPDVPVECAGDLAFEFGEDAAGLISEMSATVHDGQGAVERRRGLAAPGSGVMYQAVGLSMKPNGRMMSGEMENEGHVLTIYVALEVSI